MSSGCFPCYTQAQCQQYSSSAQMPQGASITWIEDKTGNCAKILGSAADVSTPWGFCNYVSPPPPSPPPPPSSGAMSAVPCDVSQMCMSRDACKNLNAAYGLADNTFILDTDAASFEGHPCGGNGMGFCKPNVLGCLPFMTPCKKDSECCMKNCPEVSEGKTRTCQGSSGQGRENGSPCNQNYECKSNYCVDVAPWNPGAGRVCEARDSNSNGDLAQAVFVMEQMPLRNIKVFDVPAAGLSFRSVTPSQVVFLRR